MIDSPLVSHYLVYYAYGCGKQVSHLELKKWNLFFRIWHHRLHTMLHTMLYTVYVWH